MFFALFKGFAASAGLIVAIGAQNAFVIKQGLLRSHLFMTALICSVIDSLLIFVGVLGFGEIITAYPFLMQITKYLAVAFLFTYGCFALKSAFQNRTFEKQKNENLPSAKKTVLVLLALCLLNPHVYLDTVILLGSIASQHPSHEQIYFALGAISASFLWFFSLTYLSRYLAPLLSRPNAWKVIDGLIAVTMWTIAFSIFYAL